MYSYATKHCIVYEYFAQQNLSKLGIQTLGKSCLFEFKAADGLGILSIPTQMFRIRREIEFMDDEQAFEISGNFNKRNGSKIRHSKVLLLPKFSAISRIKTF